MGHHPEAWGSQGMLSYTCRVRGNCAIAFGSLTSCGLLSILEPWWQPWPMLSPGCGRLLCRHQWQLWNLLSLHGPALLPHPRPTVSMWLLSASLTCLAEPQKAKRWDRCSSPSWVQPHPPSGQKLAPVALRHSTVPWERGTCLVYLRNVVSSVTSPRQLPVG